MRKSYLIIAAVATTFLASCANETVLNEHQDGNEQTVIGFSSYSEKSTRGVENPSDLEYFHGTFTVYGSKKSTVDNAISEVFDGGATALITYSNGGTTPNDWTYSPYRFWDKQANYKFIAVAPNANIVKYDWNPTAVNLVEVGTEANDFVTVSGGYTLKGQNLQKTATAKEISKGFTGIGDGTDTDLMTSEMVPENGATHSANVNLTFKHILAKLNVTVAKASVLNDADVYINSIEITGLKDNGSYDESTYVKGDENANPIVLPHSGWIAANSANAANYKLAYDYTNDGNKEDGKIGKELNDYDATNTKPVPTWFIESLVMPQAVAAETVTLTLKYQIVTGSGETAHKENYTYTLDMNKAFASYLDRHNYTLNLTIEPTVITFDAGTTPWDNGGTDDKTIY